MGLRFNAWRDFLKHYGTVFRHAWQHRTQMDSPERLNHEAEFLPAALSLQETPISPAPRVTLWVLIIFSVLVLLWAILGQMDIVATAQGKIIPSERSKVIQPLETATIRSILVRDGQAVKAGDTLIELDATVAQADKDRVLNDLVLARLQVARAQSLLDVIRTEKEPRGNNPIKRPKDVDDTHLAEANVLVLGQISEYLAKLSRTEAEISRREAELRSTMELVNKLDQTVPIAQQKAASFKHLYDKQFIAKYAYLEQEQIRIEQEADLANQKSRLKEIEASLKEARGQKRELVNGSRRTALDSMTEGQQKIATLEQELLKSDVKVQSTHLTAPVDGTVQQMVIHTVGGVVTPAQALMVIVPTEPIVEIEAFLENKDIGFVKEGQDAEVKVETFQYTKYGTIHAKVLSVSHDAISDEKKGLIYATRIKMQQPSLEVDGTHVNLSPGMAVSVEIKTGKRRVIEYFLSPLIQHSQESLKER